MTIKEVKEIKAKMDKTGYAYKVLSHMLQKGSITSFEAFQEMRNTRLSATIFVLRNNYGIPIDTERVNPKNGKPYGRYKLIID